MSDKEATNMSGKERPAKKPKVKQSCIGDFLDSSKCFRTNKKTGCIETFKVTAGSELVGDKHKCQHCESSFKTRNALGNHYNFCKPALARKKEEGKKMSATGMVAATVFGGSVALKKEKLSQESTSYSSVSSQILNKKTTVSNKDKRKGNRGSNICESYFPEEKL